jgi:hypothetical protein
MTMIFRNTSDASSETKIQEVTHALIDLGFEEYFEEKQYDDTNLEIFVILMCRDPYLKFKQRIRLAKQENTLYLDIMLDYYEMRDTDTDGRKKIVAEKLVVEIPEIIAKYNKKKTFDFDLNRFTADLKDWFVQNKWIE